MTKHMKKLALNEKRKGRIRKKISGNIERPRLSVSRTLKHISCQLIDDTTGRTLVTVTSTDKELGIVNGGNIDAATKIGVLAGEKIKKAGIEKIVFDRNGKAYHGRVKALAEAVRSSGIQF